MSGPLGRSARAALVLVVLVIAGWCEVGFPSPASACPIEDRLGEPPVRGVSVAMGVGSPAFDVTRVRGGNGPLIADQRDTGGTTTTYPKPLVVFIGTVVDVAPAWDSPASPDRRLLGSVRRITFRVESVGRGDVHEEQTIEWTSMCGHFPGVGVRYVVRGRTFGGSDVAGSWTADTIDAHDASTLASMYPWHGPLPGANVPPLVLAPRPFPLVLVLVLVAIGAVVALEVTLLRGPHRRNAPRDDEGERPWSGV